jgi:hypothetical protein
MGCSGSERRVWVQVEPGLHLGWRWFEGVGAGLHGVSFLGWHDQKRRPQRWVAMRPFFLFNLLFLFYQSDHNSNGICFVFIWLVLCKIGFWGIDSGISAQAARPKKDHYRDSARRAE